MAREFRKEKQNVVNVCMRVVTLVVNRVHETAIRGWPPLHQILMSYDAGGVMLRLPRMMSVSTAASPIGQAVFFARVTTSSRAAGWLGLRRGVVSGRPSGKGSVS